MSDVLIFQFRSFAARWRRFTQRHLNARPHVAGLVLLFIGCAGRPIAPQLDWLPEGQGWTLRDVDESSPPMWVAYDREAPSADVKEIRVVGLVNAAPKVAMQALRHRLLDESYVPEGVEVTILHESKEAVVTYGFARMPWPFQDREITEEMRFTHDDRLGTFHIDGREVASDEEVPRGVVRIPIVRNSFVVAPADQSGSVLTFDSIHDLGGAFPNWITYGPIRSGMIDVLHEVRKLTVSLKDSPLEGRSL